MFAVLFQLLLELTNCGLDLEADLFLFLLALYELPSTYDGENIYDINILINKI